MIASFFDGRVRIRRDELKNFETMDAVISLIRAQDGVIDLVPNRRTGSLVVTYDPEKIPRETIMDVAAMFEKQFGLEKQEDQPQKSTRRKKLSPLAETGLLAGVYSLTMLSGFVSKRAHVFAALLFTGLAITHVYTRRRLL